MCDVCVCFFFFFFFSCSAAVAYTHTHTHIHTHYLQCRTLVLEHQQLVRKQDKVTTRPTLHRLALFRQIPLEEGPHKHVFLILLVFFFFFFFFFEILCVRE